MSLQCHRLFITCALVNNRVLLVLPCCRAPYARCLPILLAFLSPLKNCLAFHQHQPTVGNTNVSSRFFFFSFLYYVLWNLDKYIFFFLWPEEINMLASSLKSSDSDSYSYIKPTKPSKPIFTASCVSRAWRRMRRTLKQRKSDYSRARKFAFSSNLVEGFGG